MSSPYNIEQSETLAMVHEYLGACDPAERQKLLDDCRDYLAFRDRVEQFLTRHFNDLCSEACYNSQRSACCGKEGIITFFADMVVNVLASEPGAIDAILETLKGKGRQNKCIYLGDHGCLWNVTPIVCQMFLCDRAKETVFSEKPELREQWEALEAERKLFTWPDRPVLFDHLERFFMHAGCESPLMYLHNSPGLLRVKRMAGLESPEIVDKKMPDAN